MYSKTWLVPALAVLVAIPAAAQTVVLRPRASATAGVTVTTVGTELHAGVTGTNVDVRTAFRDLALKSKANIVLAPNAAGQLRQAVTSQPLEAAIRAIASGAGLSVRTLIVPTASAAKVTPETAGALASALADSAVNATVVDPATGRNVTLTFSSTAPKAETGMSKVYYVFRQPRRGPATAASGSMQDAVANAAASFSELPAGERMQAMRALTQQMFESMTPEEREAMRGQMGGRGRGGWGPRDGQDGQRGGWGPRDGQDGPPGPPPGGFDGPPPGNFDGPPPMP